MKPTNRPKSQRTRGKRSSLYRSKQTGSVVYLDDAIVFLVPKKLKSGNKLKSGIARHGDTKSWELHFHKCVTANTIGSLAPQSGPVKMRLEIVRKAPRKQFFLDPTNLAIGAKGLEDALVRMGYLHDDAEEWIDGPHCLNAVSDDGKYWTVVRISAAA